ncbi:hypothetical protein pb186bvf_005770 [Paramecium bursaria]
MQQDHVQIQVQDTNEEAMFAKLSAIKRGYFEDEFAEEFVKPSGKKDVIIHRGYWQRIHIFRRVIQKFIQLHNQCQIISLGCGYDTLPFIKIKQHQDRQFKYYETDLEVVVKKKIKKIQQSPKIKGLLNDLVIGDTIQSQKYALFGCDLQIQEKFFKGLEELNINYNLPTIIFAECVLTYIDSKATDNLLKAMKQKFAHLDFLNYEMFNPNDQFGKMMVKNFEYRGCPLIGIDAYPSLHSQIERLTNLGYENVKIADMKTLYHKGTDQEERQRIEKIELMDEWEEWNIMQSHYFVCLASADIELF